MHFTVIIKYIFNQDENFQVSWTWETLFRITVKHILIHLWNQRMWPNANEIPLAYKFQICTISVGHPPTVQLRFVFSCFTTHGACSSPPLRAVGLTNCIMADRQCAAHAFSFWMYYKISPNLWYFLALLSFCDPSLI